MVFEDEHVLAGVIGDYLRHEGFEAELHHDGREAVATILTGRPDLVILDLMLPGKDGLTICQEVREISNVPIIFETARAEESDRLLGLGIGADDYICKPFSPRELVARVKAVLRRSETKIQPLFSAGIVIDEQNWTARINGTSLDLTPREFQILSVLAKRPGRVFSRAQLLDLTFPEDAEVIDRTIDSHIKNIRAKVKTLAPDLDPIRSVYGVGYAFEN